MRWVIGDLLTGNITADLDVLAGSWADQINTAASFDATVNVWDYVDPITLRKRLPLNSMTVEWRSFLGCIDEQSGRVLAAGPITARPWDDESQSVKLAASGLWSYWYRRVLIPAYTTGRITDLTTAYVMADGLSLGDIAVKVVQQSMAHPGGNLPIDLPALTGGDSERTYPGLDAAYIGDRLKQLVEVVSGPDIVFQPYLQDDLHMRWAMRVGNDTDPYVHQNGTPQFDYSAPKSGATGLSIEGDSTNMTSRDFEMGGGQTDEVLAGQSFNPQLVSQGWPLLESVTSRSTVSDINTLDAYAQEATDHGMSAYQTWSLTFKQLERPALSTYWTGDFARLRMSGHPWIEDGNYQARIVGLAGDDKGTDVRATFQPGPLVSL